jgi:hypothetical protein
MEASNYQTIYLLSRDASASSPSTYVTNWLNLWSGGSLTSNVAAAISTAVGVNVVSGTTSGSSVTFNIFQGRERPDRHCEPGLQTERQHKRLHDLQRR